MVLRLLRIDLRRLVSLLELETFELDYGFPLVTMSRNYVKFTGNLCGFLYL